ncbi:MAG: 50S ribosomal protein L6 [Thiotrichaceae bacterium IS1]|nr:MAG: 50S ribosomal protein L6 [Thiotrichaceae bacterium IS1]
MSRVAKMPVTISKGVEVTMQGQELTIKGKKGSLKWTVGEPVEIKMVDNALTFTPRHQTAFANALAGTTRALVNNMVKGVTEGFEKKLSLVGVGYKAQVQGKALNLTLGFSHPVSYPIPDGITIETPTQTEILIKGLDRQQVGQVATNIRAYRPPEPYRGKGVRYTGETIILKEAKKK